MTLCNYCGRAARTVLRWRSRVRRRGGEGWRTLHVQAAACPEHEGCANFVAAHRLHPDALVQVNPAVRP